jgi:hypothetical protein
MPLRKVPFGVEGIFMVISFSFDNTAFSKKIQNPISFTSMAKAKLSNGSVIIWLTESICVCTHLLQNSHIKTKMCFQQSSMWHACEFSWMSIWGTLTRMPAGDSIMDRESHVH